MQKVFSEKIDVKLISLVKQHPELYDTGNPKYMDFNAREVAWQKIGDELKKPAADCKVRWINIRDVHRRILRLSMSRSTRPKRAYKYDKHMEFIKNFYKEVVPPSNGEENSDNEDSEPWTDAAVDYDQESPEEVDSKPIKKRKRSNKSPKKSNSFEEVELPTEPVIHDAPEIDVTDPVDTFLISIGATLKRFSPYHLNLAKSKIFHIVQEHDLQQIVDRQPRSDSIATDTPVYYQG